MNNFYKQILTSDPFDILDILKGDNNPISILKEVINEPFLIKRKTSEHVDVFEILTIGKESDDISIEIEDGKLKLYYGEKVKLTEPIKWNVDKTNAKMVGGYLTVTLYKKEYKSKKTKVDID